MWKGKLTTLEMIWKVSKGRKTSTQQQQQQQNQQNDMCAKRRLWGMLSAWRKLGSLATLWAHSETSDQAGRVPSPMGAVLTNDVHRARSVFFSVFFFRFSARRQFSHTDVALLVYSFYCYIYFETLGVCLYLIKLLMSFRADQSNCCWAGLWTV